MFNAVMKRYLLAPVATVLLTALLPAAASAATVDLGQTSSAVTAPVCPAGVSPANCTIVLTQVTAMSTVRDGVPYPSTVKKAGIVVALTIGVSALSSNASTAKSDVSNLDAHYGGPAEAELAVLRSANSKIKRWEVVAQSPPFDLEPFLGQVVQFPLAAPLPVVPGEVIGVTVPTWAPILSFALTPATKFAYQQSRATGCTTTPLGFAQGAIGASVQYGCGYTGTRVEYTATEITSAIPNS
ncbi:MAG: hypothetical protein ACLQID_15180 [Streptosporangiaceae bacterium]